MKIRLTFPDRSSKPKTNARYDSCAESSACLKWAKLMGAAIINNYNGANPEMPSLWEHPHGELFTRDSVLQLLS